VLLARGERRAAGHHRFKRANGPIGATARNTAPIRARATPEHRRAFSRARLFPRRSPRVALCAAPAMCLKWVDDSRVPTTLSVASSARAMRLIAQLNVVVYANLALAIGFILSKQLTTGILDLVAFVYGWLLLRSEGHINSRLLSTVSVEASVCAHEPR
jgi:hypothetical protein